MSTTLQCLRLQKWNLTTGLFVLLVFTISCGQTDSKSDAAAIQHSDIDVAQFDKLRAQDNYVVLDIRTPEETSEGVVDNALILDFYADNFESEVLTMDKDKQYLVYCRSGGRSAQAAEFMARSGFQYVYNLLGGYTAWSEAHPDK